MAAIFFFFFFFFFTKCPYCNTRYHFQILFDKRSVTCMIFTKILIKQQVYQFHHSQTVPSSKSLAQNAINVSGTIYSSPLSDNEHFLVTMLG